MFTNTQPREGKTGTGDKGNTIDLVKIWYTIQGEGPFQGTPAVFIRLAGCNLNCAYCDTDYTKDRQEYRVQHIVDYVSAIRERSLVVITGGEPFRQNIGPLVQGLIDKGNKVQIETNGTLYRTDIPRWLYGDMNIVCSPKAPTINCSLWPYIKALKYVLAADSVSPEDGLPDKVLGSPYAICRPIAGFTGGVFLQPEDHQDPIRNKANVDAAVASCMKYGYRLCLQQHKIIGLE